MEREPEEDFEGRVNGPVPEVSPGNGALSPLRFPATTSGAVQAGILTRAMNLESDLFA